MDRGGQIFYVYNRVETIDQKVSELHELVPEARIGFVHGQMSEVMLENTLLDFSMKSVLTLEISIPVSIMVVATKTS